MIRLLILTGFLITTGCIQRSEPRESGSAPGQIVAVSDTIPGTWGTDTVRFGRMHSGEIAVKRLLLHNRTHSPLAIVSYARSCGCTTLEYDNQPLMPGQQRPVTLTFDSRGERGWQLKIMEVSFAGEQRPLKLFIEAEVE